MGYTAKTIQELMTLVDNHKDEINEASYIQICNAIVQLPEPSQNSILNTYRSNPYVRQMRERISHLEVLVDSFQHILSTATPGRIINEDKFKVLTNDYGYSGPNKTTDMNIFSQQLFNNHTLTKRRFKELCEIVKRQRYIDRCIHYQNQITTQTRLLENTRTELISYLTSL